MAKINYELPSWTFFREDTPSEELEELLVKGEKILACYKTFRDTAIITDKRFIISDVQGITGKKVEIFTIPFNSIIMYSTENAGILDINSEIELWTKVGNVKIKLKRGIDVRGFDKLLADHIL